MSFALNIIAKTSIVLVCAALLSILLRRASASTRHAVWMVTLAGTLLLPFVTLLIPQLELPVLLQTSTSVNFLPIGNQPLAATSAVERGLKPSTTYWTETLVWLGLIWLVGFTLLLLRLLLGTGAVRRLAKPGSAFEDENWRRMVTELSRTFSIDRPVLLFFSDTPISPMTWGVFGPTVLLPSSAMQWSDERRRLVLAHELAHVKRNDGMIQIFIQVVCSIYWFNPLVWYAAHRMRIERERACDDHVLNLGMAAEDYADHLVQIVRGLSARRSLSFAAVSMAQPSQLETRLFSILDSRVRRGKLSKVGVAFLSIFAGLLTIGFSLFGVTAAIPVAPVFIVAPRPPVITPQRTRIGDAGAARNSLVVPPRVIESSPPSYPDTGLKIRIEGIVTLEARVDVRGNATILRVVKSLGYGLDEKAIEAVQRWKFAPALSNGSPVEAVTQIDVDFKLPPEPPGLAPPGASTTFRVGRDVLPPVVLTRVQPEYTDEARAAKIRGTVIVSATIQKDGTLKVESVVQGLDYGLTDKAIEALEQWTFKPGTRNGQPVDVLLNIEVNFNLR
jgi:TonB family protein